ncbi:Alpha-D-kanosaminyltransferase [Posidoniimonas corsicana]|uniref:Alpha-D-kanosaminyltransferase n=2 Tax=Posidoniimonas corsicana TaxID=1938618 RepID=A0A5C5V5E2_9BACT|nr:Alpha-D-kanosaminyltransferase [Posidoniimonas corsicana]
MPMVLHPRVVTGSGGGPDKTILNSPRFLRSLGYDSACMYLRPPNDPGFEAIRARAEELGAPLEEIDDRGAADWRVLSRALEVCRRLDVRVWHGHDYKTNLMGLLLRRWRPMRLVTTVHGWVHHTSRTPLYYKLDRWALKHYERVICVSPDLLEECSEIGVREDRRLLIENAIDCKQFRRRRSPGEARQALGLPADGFLIGGVGRLSPEKGFDVLVRSVARLHVLGMKPMLAILGDGDQRTALQSLIDTAGLGAHARLMGFQSNTREWFEAMDLFALSSLREGLPNVALEAMAVETPVVATRVAGVPRLIQDGRSGLIVPIGDEEALSGAICQLITDPRMRADIAANGRRVIEDQYNFSSRMEKIRDVYASLGV